MCALRLRPSYWFVVEGLVLIKYLRTGDEAKAYFERIEDVIYASPISIAELFARTRVEKETEALEIFLWNFDNITLDNKIATRGGLFRNQFLVSHNIGSADTLISPTAENICPQLSFLTVNMSLCSAMFSNPMVGRRHCHSFFLTQ